MSRISPAMLNLTATINNPTQVLKADGTSATTFTANTGFLCAIQPRKSSESLLRGKDMGTIELVAYFPSSATVLAMTSRSTVTQGSNTYRVEGPPRDASGWGDFYAVDLVKDA